MFSRFAKENLMKDGV